MRKYTAEPDANAEEGPAKDDATEREEDDERSSPRKVLHTVAGRRDKVKRPRTSSPSPAVTRSTTARTLCPGTYSDGSSTVASIGHLFLGARH